MCPMPYDKCQRSMRKVRLQGSYGMVFGCLDSFRHWVVRWTKSSVMSTSKLRAVDMAVLNLFN